MKLKRIGILTGGGDCPGLNAVIRGDNDPIHYDVEYCRRRGHPGMLAHGMQVMVQTAAGAGVFPHLVADSLVAMLECSASFKGPVYAGDTLYPLLEITEVTPQRTTGVIAMRATVHLGRERGETWATDAATRRTRTPGARSSP